MLGPNLSSQSHGSPYENGAHPWAPLNLKLFSRSTLIAPHYSSPVIPAIQSEAQLWPAAFASSSPNRTRASAVAALSSSFASADQIFFASSSLPAVVNARAALAM